MLFFVFILNLHLNAVYTVTENVTSVDHESKDGDVTTLSGIMSSDHSNQSDFVSGLSEVLISPGVCERLSERELFTANKDKGCLPLGPVIHPFLLFWTSLPDEKFCRNSGTVIHSAVVVYCSMVMSSQSCAKTFENDTADTSFLTRNVVPDFEDVYRALTTVCDIDNITTLQMSCIHEHLEGVEDCLHNMNSNNLTEGAVHSSHLCRLTELTMECLQATPFGEWCNPLFVHLFSSLIGHHLKPPMCALLRHGTYEETDSDIKTATSVVSPSPTHEVFSENQKTFKALCGDPKYGYFTDNCPETGPIFGPFLMFLGSSFNGSTCWDQDSMAQAAENLLCSMAVSNLNCSIHIADQRQDRLYREIPDQRQITEALIHLCNSHKASTLDLPCLLNHLNDVEKCATQDVHSRTHWQGKSWVYGALNVCTLTEIATLCMYETLQEVCDEPTAATSALLMGGYLPSPLCDSLSTASLLRSWDRWIFTVAIAFIYINCKN